VKTNNDSLIFAFWCTVPGNLVPGMMETRNSLALSNSLGLLWTLPCLNSFCSAVILLPWPLCGRKFLFVLWSFFCYCTMQVDCLLLLLLLHLAAMLHMLIVDCCFIFLYDNQPHTLIVVIVSVLPPRCFTNLLSPFFFTDNMMPCSKCKGQRRAGDITDCS